MCAPAVALTALTIGSTVTGFAGQWQQAQAQQQYQSRLAAASHKQIADNAEITRRAYFDNLNQSSLRAAENREAASQQAIQVSREAAGRKSAFKLSAIESGVSGQSINLLAQDFDAREAEWRSNLLRNQDFYVRQENAARNAMHVQAIGRTQSIQPYIPQPVIPPSPFALAFGLGSDALYGYDRHLFYNGKGPYAP